jgi:hypothetical protein
MLSVPNLGDEQLEARPARREDPNDVLLGLCEALEGRFRPVPEATRPASDGWVMGASLLTDPEAVAPLVAAGGRRLGSENQKLVVAQVAREAISILTAAGVRLWGQQRRLPDLSAANVLLRDHGSGVVVGVRRPTLAVLPDDPLAVTAPGIEVLGEGAMFERLVERAVGAPVPAGSVPPGAAEEVAAVAAVVTGTRRFVRCGDRHLWGTAALAVSSTLTKLSHTVGKQADRDRQAILRARPDLARTVELVTVDDTAGDEITFAVRRTCCLLYKLQDDAAMCSTCSLRDRSTQIATLTTWYRAQRQRHAPRQ